MKLSLNLELMELMLYYWQATSEKEKVGESYLLDIANHQDMKPLYDGEFTAESVRKALSAISNKEKFTPENKKEGRFWNNNMWMLEDLDFMMMMYGPIKKMNLDECSQMLSASEEQVSVHFVPGHMDLCFREGNHLYINFFRVQADLYEEDKITLEGLPLCEFIKEQLS